MALSGKQRFFLLLMVLMLSAMPLAAEQNLIFGVYTADKPSVVVRQFRPALNELEKSMSAQLGEPVKIKMQVARSYEQGVAELVAGQVDFSRFGPASYVLAKRQNPQLRILAAEASKNKKIFYGLICVRQDSPIKSINELKGKRFAFGDEQSTIGRYLAQLYLMEHGIHATDLQSFEYLGRHDKVGAAVGVGSFDAGALKESTYKKLRSKGTPIRELARFENVTKPWIARAGLEPDLFDALQRGLLAMQDGAALKSLKKTGFLAADDADYDRIRQSIEQNPAFFKGIGE